MSAAAGSARTLVIQPTGGTGQHARPHETFAQPLTARLVDRDSHMPVSGAEVTFSWVSTSQQVLFEGDEITVAVRTDADGSAQTPPLVAGDVDGIAIFNVTAAGAAPEQFQVTVDR
ncbi:Ig domain-containing protein [Streptomyces halobius]|uniref:Ig domain-containing protein n=1 Tax=Streptomyces halobius TaxID=2879846 RepID=A0ABY4LYN8_9ACTN|nr:Ig domain-containing protein [Streptomyces halobius]UQA90593.1 Ig domain-containing protein [Streptomyces halobius]